MTKTTTDIEKFQYDHIFNLILGIFKFSEKKYGNFVKDVIRILLEFEKNGETIIDVDNSLIIFELFEKSKSEDISPGVFISKAPLKRINYLDNLF